MEEINRFDITVAWMVEKVAALLNIGGHVEYGFKTVDAGNGYTFSYTIRLNDGELSLLRTWIDSAWNRPESRERVVLVDSYLTTVKTSYQTDAEASAVFCAAVRQNTEPETPTARNKKLTEALVAAKRVLVYVDIADGLAAHMQVTKRVAQAMLNENADATTEIRWTVAGDAVLIG